jgi:hypothetical protein
VKTIVRDQLLDDACEAAGLGDFGDVPFLEALDALVESYNHDVDLAESAGDAFAAGAARSCRGDGARSRPDRW